MGLHALGIRAPRAAVPGVARQWEKLFPRTRSRHPSSQRPCRPPVPPCASRSASDPPGFLLSFLHSGHTPLPAVRTLLSSLSLSGLHPLLPPSLPEVPCPPPPHGAHFPPSPLPAPPQFLNLARSERVGERVRPGGPGAVGLRDSRDTRTMRPETAGAREARGRLCHCPGGDPGRPPLPRGPER